MNPSKLGRSGGRMLVLEKEKCGKKYELYSHRDSFAPLVMVHKTSDDVT